MNVCKRAENQTESRPRIALTYDASGLLSPMASVFVQLITDRDNHIAAGAHAWGAGGVVGAERCVARRNDWAVSGLTVEPAAGLITNRGKQGGPGIQKSNLPAVPRVLRVKT